MNKRSRVGAIVSVALLTAGLTVSGATAASATDVSYSCGLIRGTWHSQQAQTQEVAGSCGTVGVQAHYAHIGGTSWTTWTYDINHAVRPASNTFGGKHYSTYGSTFVS